MWNFNSEIKKWSKKDDRLSRSEFEFFKQELSSTRFYSKCLSGATYLPINNLDNIYDILGTYQPRNWFIRPDGSVFSDTPIPSLYSTAITKDSAFDYHKYTSEYGLTLKNMFTPNRLIKDSLKNFIYVDLATTEQIININGNYPELFIDGVRVINKHRILVKDQVSYATLMQSQNPREYFTGPYHIVQDYGSTIEYMYYNEQNGVYEYNNGSLSKTNDLELYDDCIRYSVSVKLGDQNTQKQYHLRRLLNGYFPSSSKNEPVEFTEKHNWILRNKMDYNNLFEINYHEVKKFQSQILLKNGIEYRIPERSIAIGEFGIIRNTQYGISTIIPNKYKVNLKCLSSTENYYWVCGDSGVFLKIDKATFEITRIDLKSDNDLTCVSFFNDQKGAIVGELNTIFVTNDGGNTWSDLVVDEFSDYYYNKVLFPSMDSIYIIGNNGVFLTLQEDVTGWSITKKRISRFIDEYEEYILVDNINDMLIIETNDYDLSFAFHDQQPLVNKKLMLLTTDDSRIIIYDMNDSIPFFDFLFVDFSKDYGRIKNIAKKSNNTFYFVWNKIELDGICEFDLNESLVIGTNVYSNTLVDKINAFEVYYEECNHITVFNSELLIAGNNSLLGSYNFDVALTSALDFTPIDASLDARMKSKILFLDYDIASKLNFFTDQGEYRLPSSAQYTLASPNDDVVVTGGQTSVIFNHHLTIKNITVTDLVEVPRDIILNIDLSFTDVIAGQVNINLKAPNGRIVNLKRNNSNNGLSMASTRLTTNNQYTKISLSQDTTYDGNTYQIDNNLGVGLSGWSSNSDNFGDATNGVWSLIITARNPSITAFPTVVGNINSWGLEFIYGSDDEVIIDSPNTKIWLEAKDGQTNWMNYYFDREKTFEYYSPTPLDQSVKSEFSPTFSYATQNTLSVTPTEISSDLDIILNLIPTAGNSDASRYAMGDVSIIAPTQLKRLYITDEVGVIRLQPDGRIDIGDVLCIRTQTLRECVLVNRIVEILIAGTIHKFVYFYHTFEENIITDIVNNGFELINLNLYKDLDELIVNFNTHPIGIGYELSTSNGNLVFKPKFNNKTAYYNLESNIFIGTAEDNVQRSMDYTSGFLRFGYTPTYNILDYLTQLNDPTEASPKFHSDKEYLAMPHYLAMPLPASESFTPDTLYIDYNGLISTNSNKLYFGENLKFEWDSLMVNTFVDIKIIAKTGEFTTERLLVMRKYKNTNAELVGQANFDVYVIEFHKEMNYPFGEEQYTIDILSRRKLGQISHDLQELNNIHRGKFKTSKIVYNSQFTNYEREMNFKIHTDSYAKILLSDVDTISEISAMIYVDYKNELAVNITRLEKEYNVPIQSLSSYISDSDPSAPLVYIRCAYNHDLKTGDGVVIEFTGTASNSNTIVNPQYFGYHNVTVIDPLSFHLDIPFGNFSVDTGVVKYVKRDPFLSYEPVDIIDYGVDKRGKNSIELNIDNLQLTNERYSLVNVDFEKFRFKLVDGLTLEDITIKYPWILEAEIQNAVIGTNGTELVWYSGTWLCGRWFGGIWHSGTWYGGDWYGGTWYAHQTTYNGISVEVAESSSIRANSTWHSGRWYDGTWVDGTWVDGRWYNGTWSNGYWISGTWNNGTWNNGEFTSGIFVQGVWNNGIFNCNNGPSYWIDGVWNGGDFENGNWYSGIFQSDRNEARFGTRSFNSRPSRWFGGKFLSGTIFSALPLAGDTVSESHRYTIWYTGLFQSGNVHGGIFYNLDLHSCNWYGGISDEIQVIQIVPENGYILLNGEFNFLPKDNIYINTTTDFLTTSSYNVIYSEVDKYNKQTRVYIDFALPQEVIDTHEYIEPQETNIRVISRFRFANWHSGIWKNGLFDSGNWNGGIWYNGIFNEKGKFR